AGGSLEYNGTASVLSVTVDEGASLSGTGLYSLNTITDEEQGVSVGGTFTNNGTYSPGSGLAAGDGADAIASVSIDGNYEQGETGTLVLSFDEEAATDVLTISGKATLAGTVAFAAVRDYYADGTITLALADMVSAEELAVSESLALDLLDVSPTLDMTLASGTAADGADSSYTISAARSASAYSRYAASGQQAELAGNLDEIGQTDLTAAAGDLGDARELLTALDFSASDGSDLPGAYEELGPDAFTKAAQASLSLQRSLSAQIVNGRLLASASGSNAGQAQAMAAGDEEGSAGSMRVFATPMGGRNVSFSGGGADTSYYGLLAGAETDIALGRDSLTLGVHAAFLHTEGSANDNDKAKGDNISLGLHGRWDPDLSLDAGSLGSVSPYVMGLVRGGLETRHMEREVSFNGYNRKAESDWSAPTFSALLGTGLDVRPCDAIVFGPVLWLDWTAMWRPSVEEDGGLAADLELDAATYQSLRSSLGARVNVRLHDGPDAARLAGSLNLSLTAVWNHEFLYDNGATTARFAHFGSTSFTDRADVSDRDTFGGMLQLTGHLTDNVSLSLFGGLEQGPKTSDAHGGA
ncbi:MAG: autotransporter outer membrane beta-barrel domain-containing protein, partial [Desulfovibrionaceae bacterium]|nr:autotransporter outer membrane beta-barrel domain-containing protein [Desulfovibrionaceae bacterium]